MKNVRSATTVLATALAILLTALPTFGQKAIPPAGPGPCSDAASKTHLLFPFMTNQAGFDTGFAIANTGSDPFGTVGAAGTCTLTFYGTSPPAPVTTPSVAQGASYVTITSALAPGFQGYMIASCNFPLAHGFAFVSDFGAQKLASSYLPTNICTPRTPPN